MPQDSYAPASPWMIKGQIPESLRGQYLKKFFGSHVEGQRYPIIHELSLHRYLLDSTYDQLQEKISGVKELVEALPAAGGPLSPAKPKGFKALLKEARDRLEKYEGHFRALEKWALQDGKDKAISREAALDIVFRLYRASTLVIPPGGSIQTDSGIRYLHEVHRRRYPGPDTGPGFKFGVAVIDLNITGPNSVDRMLGDLVLEEAYLTFKEFFADSVVTRGTRTNFRIVNPEGANLTQEKLLELESTLHQRVVKRVGPGASRKWRKFLKGYQLNLSAGYEEVRFQAEDVKKGPAGEYTLETILDLLEKIDRGFQMANARSQEVNSRLKEVKNPWEAARVVRLNHGQFPILDLNGPPEGRFFEPLEVPTSATEAIRIVHNLKRTLEHIREVREALGQLEYVLAEKPGDTAARQQAVDRLEKALPLLESNQKEFRQIYFDISHDIRMPRMIDRSFAAERVDAIVRETGGARLLFIELGKFYSFVRTWYGGSQDKYVHEMILEFYKVLAKNRMELVHPTNRAPLLSDGHLAVDPKTGGYFPKALLSGTPPIQFLVNPGNGTPVAREMIVGMRDGDEIGFVIGERDAKGRYVGERVVREIFGQFDEVIREKYGSMEFDNIEKVGKDKVRIPTWQILSYRPGKKKNAPGRYKLMENNVLRTELEMTRDFTGIVQDYVGVPQSEVDPAAPKENAKIIVARRPRWRFFEGGKLAPNVEIFLGEPIFPSEGTPPKNPGVVPEAWVQGHPEIRGKPLLVKMQTPLSAGYVSVKLRRGSDLEKAWETANNLSKKSKERDGAPIPLVFKANVPPKPAGHAFDQAVSAERTRQLVELYAPYSKENALAHAPELSREMRRFLKRHQSRLAEFINPQSPEVFEESVKKLIEREVEDLAERDRLKAELQEHVKNRGELLQIRDAMMVVQVLQREGLSLNLKTLAPAFWQSLAQGQKIFGSNGLKEQMGRAKTQLVKLYVQQTGELPPPDILEEARRYIEPTSIFIPEEVYSLARRYQVPPEKVPYFVAGLKAAQIQQYGKEAFRNLTFEDLHRLAESREGQEFLKDPKNALLIRDTLGARVVYQGVPLATAMMSVFPAEMMAGYLAEKIGKKTGLSAKQVQELKFGMTLYLAHGINITATGVWEVSVNRLGAARGIYQRIGEKVNIGILRSAKLAGQPIVQVGLKSGGGYLRAVADGVIEKWGISYSQMGLKGMAWHGLKAIPRVPLQMLKTMGAGYFASRIYDRAMGTWFSPDHPIRKYGSFGAFFLPDILRMTLGSNRIAASPILSHGGKIFTRVGNGVLATAIADFAFSQIFVRNDYQRSVQKRVADKVYDKDVYKLEWTDLAVVPFLVKGIRAGARELVPTAMDWAVTDGNSKIKREVLEEDLKNSRDVTKFLQEGFSKILLHPSAFRLDDPQAYRKVDLSLLTQRVELTDMEKKVLKTFQDCNHEVGEKELRFVPEDQMEAVLQRVLLYNLQQSVRYLWTIDQFENQWVRSIFKEDGTLRAEMADRLLPIIVPSAKGEPSAENKLLASRKLLVALAFLNGQKQFQGLSVETLAIAAGILDNQGKWVLGPDLFSALSVFSGQARESGDPGLQEKLAAHAGHLQAEYLLASPDRKKEILLALACLGISPGENKNPSE